MNQKEGVFAAVSQVFDLSEGAVPETGKWNKQQAEQVHAHVLAGFTTGQIEYRGGCPSVEKLNKYIPGLVNNWVRKDTRLNGGAKYEVKKPGSRTGSGDDMLKNMKLLLSVTTEPEAKAKIEAAIEERITALKPKTEIDASKLPEHLRHLVAVSR